MVTRNQRRWQNRLRWWWHDDSTFWERWPDWAATPLHHLMDGPVMRVVCWLDGGHVDSSYGHCIWCKRSMP